MINYNHEQNNFTTVDRNPELSTLVNNLVDNDGSEVEKDKALIRYKIECKKQARKFKHFYTDKDVEPSNRRFTSVMGADYEFLPATETTPPTPLTLALSFYLRGSDSLIQDYDKTLTDSGYYKLSSKFDLPYCLGIYIIPEKDLFPKVASNSKVWVVSIAFDHRGVSAGVESLAFLQAMLNNMERLLGITIEKYSIDHKKGFDNVGFLQQNTKLYVTYSEAEGSVLFPDTHTQANYQKQVKELAYKHGGYIKDNKTQFQTIQGTTYFKDLWLFDYNPNLLVGDGVVYGLDIQDTRCYGGNSVKGLGESLGSGKVEGFDFSKHNASYYLEHYPEEFVQYNCKDSAISLGITHIKNSHINVLTELAEKDIIEPLYFDGGKNVVTWEWLASLRKTTSSIAEVVIFASMRNKGLFDDGSKSGFDKAEGVFPTDRDKYKGMVGLDYQKIKGGLNQRTTGTMMPEFLPNVKQYDASAMYPSVLKSIKVPLYEPEGFGSCKTTVRDLVVRLDGLDYYTLCYSLEFPKDSPKSKRLILQHYGDKCFVARKVEKQIITPPELEYIAYNFPELEIKIHHGWVWDKTTVDDPKYLDLSDVMDALLDIRNKYKGVDKLKEISTKLIMNSGSYGKFAQSKEQINPEAYENAVINGDNLDAIVTKENGGALLSHPLVANAITGSARALIALTGEVHNAYLCVTDSVLIPTNTPFNLENCYTGYKWLDSLVEGASFKDETSEGEYMAILTGVRGRTLIPKNVTLPSGNSNELESLLSNLDSKAKKDKAETLIKELATKMSDGDVVIPKIAKDGVKYDGKDWEQWRGCSLDCIERLYGNLLKKDIYRLVKRNEVISKNCKHRYVNAMKQETRTLDIVDVGSKDFEDVGDYFQTMNMKAKCKNRKDKPYRSFGEAYRYYHDDWLDGYKRAKPRAKHNRSVPSEDKRIAVFSLDLGIMSSGELSKVLGVGERVIRQWKSKLIGSNNYQLWFKSVFKKLVEHKSLRHISENCKLDATGAFEQSSLARLIDETFAKKISKVVDELLKKLEKSYNCKIKKRSKRAKKLVVDKVA